MSWPRFAQYAQAALFVTLAASSCGKTAEVAREPLRDAPTDSSMHGSTALYVAMRDGAASIVRVDAANAALAPLTKPLPTGFRVGSFLVTAGLDRFLVIGETNDGHVRAYAGNRSSWHVLAELDSGWWVGEASPSLKLIALKRHDDVGRPTGGRIVSFDGTLVEDLGSSLEPKMVDDEGFITVEYELDQSDDSFVRVGRDKQPWWVVRADGTRARIEDLRSPFDAAFAIGGGFTIWSGAECSVFRWDAPERPAATYACSDIAPPLVFDGPVVYRAGATGRDRIGVLPEVADAVVAAPAPDGLTVFVQLREGDGTQVVTFAAHDGARMTYDPGNAGGRDFGAVWTRATSRAGRACVVASRTGCEGDWSGFCLRNIVDIACSDAHTLRTKRSERVYDQDGNVIRGGEQFVITDDAAFVLWTDGGALHRLDARTFDETVLDSTWTFGPREGDLPNVFNRETR